MQIAGMKPDTAAGGLVWSLPIDGGSPTKLGKGDSLTVEHDTGDLIVKLDEGPRVRVVRMEAVDRCDGGDRVEGRLAAAAAASPQSGIGAARQARARHGLGRRLVQACGNAGSRDRCNDETGRAPALRSCSGTEPSRTERSDPLSSVLLRRGALDVRRPRTLRALLNLELDAITLAQIGDALAKDRALMKEILLPRLTLDEPKAFVDSQRPNCSSHLIRLQSHGEAPWRDKAGALSPRARRVAMSRITFTVFHGAVRRTVSTAWKSQSVVGISSRS